MPFLIEPVSEDCLEQTLELVSDVFKEFEAPEYTQEGIDEFMRYIAPDSIRNMIAAQALLVWVYKDRAAVRGVIAIRPPSHISLLFVDRRWHKAGIARSLFEHVLTSQQVSTNAVEMTVNSSPYAVGFYRRMGFVETEPEKVTNGIRYIPMIRPAIG